MAKIIKGKVAIRGGVEENLKKFSLYTFLLWSIIKVLNFFEAFPYKLMDFLMLILGIIFTYTIYLLLELIIEFFIIYKKKEGYEVLMNPSKIKYSNIDTCSSCNNRISTLSYNTRQCQFCDEKLEL